MRERSLELYFRENPGRMNKEYIAGNIDLFKQFDSYKKNLKRIEISIKKSRKSKDFSDILKQKEEETAKINSIRETIYKHNQPLVIVMALDLKKRYGGELMDLIQDGNLGLEAAIRKFDTSYNVPFNLYANRSIRDSIIREYHNTMPIIHIPVWIAGKLRALRSMLEPKFSRKEYDKAIKTLKIPKKLAPKLYYHLIKVASLDEELNEEGLNYYQILPDESSPNPEKEVAAKEIRSQLEEIMESNLNGYWQAIIFERWFSDSELKGQKEVAKELYKKGKTKSQQSRQAIEQAEKRAFKHIKNNINPNLVKDALL